MTKAKVLGGIVKDLYLNIGWIYFGKYSRD